MPQLQRRASLADAREGDFFTGTYSYPVNQYENVPPVQSIKVAGQALASRSGMNMGRLFAVQNLPYFDNPQWSDLEFTYIDPVSVPGEDLDDLLADEPAAPPTEDLLARFANAQEYLESLPVGTVFRGTNAGQRTPRTIQVGGSGGHYTIRGNGVRHRFAVWHGATPQEIEIISMPQGEPLADWERELLNSTTEQAWEPEPTATPTPPDPAPITAEDHLRSLPLGATFDFADGSGQRIIISDTAYMVVSTGGVFDFEVQADHAWDFIVPENQEGS